jgi:hydrogenase maturation protease
MRERILVAGIGNIFLGDDAFGVEVVRRLEVLPASVLVKDFGIRGFDLAYAIMDGYETVILVDATPRGGKPGTLYVIEPDARELESINAGPDSFEAHGLNPLKVLALVRAMGGEFNRILVVGCEPESLGDDEDGGRMGLSAAVEAAIPEAVKMIESLIAKLLAEKSATSGTVEAALVTGGPEQDSAVQRF